MQSHSQSGNLSVSRAIPVSRLFEGVLDTVQQQLTHASSNIALDKNQRLFEHGDAAGTMFIVESGRIEISVIAEGGKKIVFNLIAPGHCFGEIGMVDHKPRTASAVALEPSRLLSITRAAFFSAVKDSPQLAINLMEIMCERIRWVSDSVEEYALHPLELRLARRLIILHGSFASPEGVVEIAQNDLADFAGATREATNKILMNWKAEGLIELGRRKIHVLDADKLNLLAYRNH